MRRNIAAAVLTDARVVEGAPRISLPSSPDGRAVISGLNASIGIGLPSGNGVRAELGDGLVGFDHGNSTWTVPIVHPEGSLQVTTVIGDRTAPTVYHFDLQLPEGAEVREEGDIITFWDSDDKFLGGIAPAWALDAEGEAVPTFFRMDGGALVQHVEHGETTAYPVVADPWLGINLFQNLYTSMESGDVRYNFSRTSWGVVVHMGAGGGVVGTAAGVAVMQTAGWDELKTPWPAITNKATLKQQYDCHTVGGWFEGEWNLERFRTNFPNWLPTSPSHLCNW